MEGILNFNNSTLTKNSASEGGAIYVSDEGILISQDSIFKKNSASNGNVAYFMNSLLESEIKNCRFDDNQKDNSIQYSIIV